MSPEYDVTWSGGEGLTSYTGPSQLAQDRRVEPVRVPLTGADLTTAVLTLLGKGCHGKEIARTLHVQTCRVY